MLQTDMLVKHDVSTAGDKGSITPCALLAACWRVGMRIRHNNGQDILGALQAGVVP